MIPSTKRQRTGADSSSSSAKMHPHASLFTLHESILQIIFEDFLCLKDLSRLDIAMTNHTDRQAFLSLLDKCVLGRNGIDMNQYKITKVCLNWLQIRGLTKFACAYLQMRNITSFLSSPLEFQDMRRLTIDYNDENHDYYRKVGPTRKNLINLFHDMFASMHNLNEFSFTGSFLDVDIILNQIALYCPKLSKLSLRISIASSLFFSSLLNLTSRCHGIKELTLTVRKMDSYNSTDKIDMLLANCPLLEKLEVDAYWLSEIYVQIIGNRCPNLTHLSCACFDCSDTDLIVLFKGCPRLISLSLYCYGEALGHFSAGLRAVGLNCPRLESLELSKESVQFVEEHADGTIVGDALVHLAQSCSNLMHVKLRTVDISDEDLIGFGRACPQLRSFSITSNGQHILDKCIIEIAENCKHLTKFCLNQCDLSDRAWEAIFIDCLQIKEVELGMYDNRKTIEIWDLMGTHWPVLESLHIKGGKLRDSNIANVAKNCSRLRNLLLEDCKGLSDFDIQSLGTYCKNLEKLILEFNNTSIISNITTEQLVQIYRNNPKLTYYSGFSAARKEIKAIIAARR